MVDALAAHDRFLVVTHENPDGDALGSMLGATLGLRALGKDVVMYLAGAAPLPAEYGFMPLGEVLREPPEDVGERVLLALDCANERRLGPDPALLGRVAARRRRRPPSRQHPLRRGQPRRGRRLLDRRDRPRPASRARRRRSRPEIAEALYIGLVTDTGRFQYANTTPKALRLAADLVEAGADVHGVFKHVYETVQFAKLKLLARALEHARVYEGGRLVISYLLRSDFAEVGAEEPYSEGIIDFLRQSEGSELVALIREPADRRRAEAPRSRLRSLERRDRRLGDRAQVGRRGPRPGGRVLQRALDLRRSSSSSAASSSQPPARPRDVIPRAASPVGIVLVDKPAGPSSHALVEELRRRTGARTGPRRDARPVRDRAAAFCCPVRQLSWLHASSGWTSATSRTSTSPRRPSTGDPEGEVLERHEPPGQAELEARLAGLRGEVELPIPAASAVKIGGERAYRLAAARGGGRDAAPPLAGLRARRHRVYGRPASRLGLHVGSGTYVRSIAEALGGHCVTLRRTAVGPFAVEEADPARLVSVAEALGRLPDEALERVPYGLRAQVLAFESETAGSRVLPPAPAPRRNA